MQRNHLREARLSHELSQNELGNLVGVTGRQIRRYEEGLAVPSDRVLQRLAETLDVTSEYLLGLVDDPQAHLSQDDLTPMERDFLKALDDPKKRPILHFMMRMTGFVIEGDEAVPTRHRVDESRLLLS